MSRSPSKPFPRLVVSEIVSIALRRRNSLGTRRVLFVHCSERDCQYVDTNAPPCPLTLDLFAAEVQERQGPRPP
jgi:hypothetical protein